MKRARLPLIAPWMLRKCPGEASAWTFPPLNPGVTFKLLYTKNVESTGIAHLYVHIMPEPWKENHLGSIRLEVGSLSDWVILVLA